MALILIVDDEVNIIKTLTSIFLDEGHTVLSSLSGQEALSLVKSQAPDLVILDVWLPDIDGIDLLEKIKLENPDISVIMISGHGSIDIAVKSTRLGAFDFIQKPPTMERVITSVNNALERSRLKKENIQLRKDFYIEDEMIGTSKKINEVKNIIDTASSTNARVFITGESGTGKELIARAIYMKSKRSDKPFVKVNCAAIPGELIESELFGYEKGAFTGAIKRKIGKFEMADTGTLFLDEICDMSLSAQAKVLRVLQENQFERVGGNETINVDVRVIAATNVEVKKAIEDGRFREDLYYRLNVIPVMAPNLSERKEDIPALVEYFLKKFSAEHGVLLKDVTDEGLSYLQNLNWPGNVRELKNIIERLSIMVHKKIVDDNDLKELLELYNKNEKSLFASGTLKDARDEFEKKFIEEALLRNRKNVAATAEEIGVERSNLYRKIKQYDIDPDSISND